MTSRVRVRCAQWCFALLTFPYLIVSRIKPKSVSIHVSQSVLYNLYRATAPLLCERSVERDP